MYKVIARLILILFILILCSLLIYRFNPFVNEEVNTNRTVYIENNEGSFNIIRNNKIFHIKGASGNNYLEELSNIGGNTIRVYNTENLEKILNEAEKNNLAVIVDLYVPRSNNSYNFYSSEEHTSKLRSDIKEVVNKYKNYPALLFWNLGNEVVYPKVLIKNNFINTYNDLIDIVHEADPNHPVATSIISKREIFSILFHSPKLDLFGFNIFGHLESLESDIQKAKFIVKPFPYYISEFGNNGPWEGQVTEWSTPIEQTSIKKAENFNYRYESYIKTDNESLGSLAFFWGHKQEYTHTWYSIFDEEGRKSETYYALKSLWEGDFYKNMNHPSLKYILLDEKGAKENLIFKPNEVKKATLLFENKVDSTYTYKWNIYKEQWHENNSMTNINKPILSLDSIPNNDKSTFTFRTPDEEGPYRVFVNVYDNKGNFSTSNIPFYVLKNNE